MGVTIIGQVGPRLVADGSNTEIRQIRDGGLGVADSHSRYAELASRGQVFSVFTPALAGSTIVAANSAPPAAAAAVLLAILNPLGSGVNLEILRSFVNHISGTPAAGPWAYCATVANGAITAATNATSTNHFNPQATSKAKAWSQTALTGGPVFTMVRLVPTIQFAGAIAATTPNQAVTEEVAGDIIVPPGIALCLAPPGAGTTHIVTVGLTWAEIPILF
jgi:hypothetical protein